jgi:hypothetical protein
LNESIKIFNGNETLFALNSILIDFDVAWTRFEERIVYCYCASMSPKAVLKKKDLIFLLSDTILYSISKNYVTQEDISNIDPKLFVILPRYMIICAYIYFDNHTSMMNSLIGRKSIGIELMKLKPEELETLELMIVGFLDPTCVSDCRLKQIFREICIIANDWQTGPRAYDFVKILKKAFLIHLA